MFTKPTVDDFKSYFARDFPFGCDIDENVLNADIQKALDKTFYKINEALWCDQGEYDLAYLNLSAHFLCTSIQASSQGLSGKFEWLLNSKSVGSVSVGQSIPESVLNDPVLSYYSKSFQSVIFDISDDRREIFLE